MLGKIISKAKEVMKGKNPQVKAYSKALKTIKKKGGSSGVGVGY
jgi:hypothetical protein